MKKIAASLLFIFSVAYTFAQTEAKDYFVADTIPAEICYSDSGCMVRDSTVMEIYNSRCIKLEKGYVLHQYDGGVLFFDDKKRIFAKTIVVWYYKELKKN